MVWISLQNTRSTFSQRAFHAKDNLRGSEGGGIGKRGDTEIRKGCQTQITGFLGFIHTLLRERIAVLKRVVITGGTGGLGTAIVREFTGNGWQVVALGRKDLDLTDGEALRLFFTDTPCDLLVCCAGIIRDTPLTQMEAETWEEVIAVNYSTAQRCAAAAVPGMRERRRGHVVFISSQAALHPAVGQSAYAVAKAALHGLAEDLATRHGDAGLRFNVVLPGFMETPMTRTVSAKRREQIRAAHLLEAFNTPAAAAAFIRFLEESMPYTSGQVFRLDSRV